MNPVPPAVLACSAGQADAARPAEKGVGEAPGNAVLFDINGIV